MKNLILLPMVLVALMSFGQSKDTIFFKSGTVLPVYKIIGNESGSIIYIPVKNHAELKIDTLIVKKVTKSLNYTDENIYSVRGEHLNLKIDRSTEDYKAGWIKYNLKKFYNEERTSQVFYGLSIVSSVVFGIAPLKNKPFLYIAGGLGTVGFILHIDSYKWIKRASLETTSNGVSLKVKF